MAFFFATSHGKSPCNGNGGTITRLVARVSLQATTGNHILNGKDFYSWGKVNIWEIEMLFVSTADIEECEVVLEPRLDDAKTIPGTRNYHSFVPVKSDSLQVQRISADVDGTSVKVTSSSQAPASQSFTRGQIFSSRLRQGLVPECRGRYIARDLLVNFMRSCNLGTTIHSFVRPSTRGECWIPFEHVLPCTVQESLPVTNGRIKQYKLNSPAIENIEDSFHKFSDCFYS